MIPVFIIIWSAWFLSEILLNRILRSGCEDRKGLDKGSVRIIWITIGLANTAGILFAFLNLVPVGKTLLIPCTGLGLIVAGMMIRFIAVYSLGRFFTVDLTIREHHKLKKDGLYRFIRHPSYTGSLASFLGFGLSLNDWISLVVIFLPVTLAMLYRIRIEEKLLVEQFGQEYAGYMNKTWRLVPLIY
jgi:protein-S-isoprenylcysteine O-methyltransferase Ste14